MKKLFLFLCTAGLYSSMIFAQDTLIVPDFTRLGLHTDFSSVAKVQWTKESENVYRGEFSVYKNKNLYAAKYDTLGNWIEKNIGIEYWQLPNSSKDEMVKRFQNFKAIKCERYETRNQKPVFHVTIEKWQPGDKNKETYFIDISLKGELLKTSGPQLASVSAD